MSDNFDFFTLFIVICIALSMCGKTSTYVVEKELKEIKQEIHILNENLSKTTTEKNVEENNDN